jgi:hypothetical protein
MKTTTNTLAILSLLILSSSSFALVSKCVLKVQIKIEKSLNSDYENCVGDSVEIEKKSFLAKKKHIFKNISKEVCLNDVASMVEGQEVVVPFTDSIWPIGFDPEVYYCTGIVTKVLKVKYRAIL